MDVREKLVELLGVITCPNTICNFCEHFHNKSACERHKKEAIADHLITNGVTVQECGHWVSLTDCSNAGVYCSVCHKKVYKEDYAWCNRKNKLRSDYCPHCGAKMMPQPPKRRMIMVKCKYEGTGIWNGRCTGTKEVDPCPGYDKCKQYKPNYTTNADRIRAMSDEELAEFLGDWAQRHRAWMCDSQGECLAWLQEPAKGGDGDE